MPEEFLDVAQVHALIEEMRGERMAERVGRDACAERGGPHVLGDESAHASVRQAAPSLVAEQGTAAAGHPWTAAAWKALELLSLSDR